MLLGWERQNTMKYLCMKRSASKAETSLWFGLAAEMKNILSIPWKNLQKTRSRGGGGGNEEVGEMEGKTFP
jgi:hypothetical protein